MSNKLVLLKSGEQIIADVKELVSSPDQEESNTLCGYILSNPHRIEYNRPILLSENISPETDGEVQITLSPWIILSNDQIIPIRADWVVTIIEPVKTLIDLYEEKVNGKNDKVSFTEE
jgi:hypothetical protein